MICKGCNSRFIQRVVINGKLRNLVSRRYCLVCSPYGVRRRDHYINAKPIIACKACGEPTKNTVFCSRSCAGKINGSEYPKRIAAVRFCTKCKTEPAKDRSKFCEGCARPADYTIGEAAYPQHKAARHALTRIRARKFVKDRINNGCQRCGYGKHVEVCHIKAITDFEPSTLLSVVNAPANLLVLCPNCHWEFDHGFLGLEEIEQKPALSIVKSS